MKEKVLAFYKSIYPHTYHIDDVHDAVEWNEFSIRNMEANGIQVVAGFKGENC